MRHPTPTAIGTGARGRCESAGPAAVARGATELASTKSVEGVTGGAIERRLVRHPYPFRNVVVERHHLS